MDRYYPRPCDKRTTDAHSDGHYKKRTYALSRSPCESPASSMRVLARLFSCDIRRHVEQLREWFSNAAYARAYLACKLRSSSSAILLRRHEPESRSRISFHIFHER
jgi:hypothetical protein